MDKATRDRLGIKLTTIKSTAVPITPTEPVPALEPTKLSNKSKRRRAFKDHSRLPDGATYELFYNAPTLTWSGSLRIPTGNGVTVFTYTAGTLFKTIINLDCQYRDSVAGK